MKSKKFLVYLHPVEWEMKQLQVKGKKLLQEMFKVYKGQGKKSIKEGGLKILGGSLTTELVIQ